jgi:hypothetical protein
LIKLTFLSAAMPLTKTFTMKDGVVHKQDYPNAKNFTSVEVEITSLVDMYKQLCEMAVAPSKPCLLKGKTTHPLKNEPRKGKMPADTATQWVCLDLDEAPFSSPSEFMRAVGLADVSHIVQYSSSYRIKNSKKLSCHIFAILSKPMKPQELKSWLTTLNLETPVLEQALSLSGQRSALHWSLDRTTCQNDKLLFIATPTFIGMKDPARLTERIQFVKGKRDTIDVSKMAMKSMTILNKAAREKTNSLRVAAGIDPLRSKLKVVGEDSIQPGADEADKYEIVDEDDEIIRLNIGDGDSRAYWIFKHNFELIRNFKGEPFTYLKEVLPDLYKQLAGTATSNDGTSTLDQSTGTTLLAFREKATSKYYAGIWEPEQQKLELNMVDNKDMLTDFLMEHQVPDPPYIPTWEMHFNPSSPVIVDIDAKRVNTFVLPPLMREAKKGAYPMIQRVLDHAVGTGAVQEHFLNWLAVIIQHRIKTKTAWILHGTEGTGKGLIVNDVLTPILQKYVVVTRVDELISEFNGWCERGLIAFIDEIEVDALEQGKPTEGKIRNLITEPTLSIRRMRTNAYNAPSYINLILSSNKPHPVRIPIGDRRFNVGQFQPVRFKTTTHEVENVLPKEVPGFAHYLLTRKADINLAAQILESEDRDLIKQLSMTSVDHIANAIVKGELSALAEYLPDENNHDPIASMYAALVRSFIVSNQRSITRDQLRIIFEHTVGKVPEGANKFTRFLAHHGLHTKRIKIDNVPHYGVQTTWHASKEDIAEWTKRFKLPTNIRRIK